MRGYLALWGHDIKEEREFPCDCGGRFSLVYENLVEGWAVQHGDNPEHRSPTFYGADISYAQRWLKSVHDRCAVS